MNKKSFILQLKQVVDKSLKKHGLYDDTLIIYTSDHGDMQGSHGMVNKDVPYEMSAGVPFIVRCPGGRKGCRSEALVSGVDIFASAMEAAGVSERGDGQSFLPYVKGDSDEAIQPWIISESLHGDRAWQMIRDERYKLVVSHPAHKPLMLFDMLLDPAETRNLISEPSSTEITEKLLSALLDAVSG